MSKKVIFNSELLASMIAAKRKWTGLVLRECAKEIGVHPSTLSRIENGVLPDLMTCKKICNWLNLDVDYFFKRG